MTSQPSTRPSSTCSAQADPAKALRLEHRASVLEAEGVEGDVVQLRPVRGDRVLDEDHPHLRGEGVRRSHGMHVWVETPVSTNVSTSRSRRTCSSSLPRKASSRVLTTSMPSRRSSSGRRAVWASPLEEHSLVVLKHVQRPRRPVRAVLGADGDDGQPEVSGPADRDRAALDDRRPVVLQCGALEVGLLHVEDEESSSVQMSPSCEGPVRGLVIGVRVIHERGVPRRG